MKTKKVLVWAVVAVMFFAANVVQAKVKTTGSVNINTASASELMALPGIGKSKAQAIVAFRAKSPFKVTQDLMQVKGIGKKVYAKLQPFVVVSGQPSIAKSKPSGAGKAKERTWYFPVDKVKAWYLVSTGLCALSQACDLQLLCYK